MHSQNQGDSNGEFGMLGLMANGVHPKETADAAANDGYPYERGFRDPPEIPPCFQLVYKHKDEPQNIDYKEVRKQIFQNDQFLSGGMA